MNLYADRVLIDHSTLNLPGQTANLTLISMANVYIFQTSIKNLGTTSFLCFGNISM